MKVVIIGCGNVGMSYAYALLNNKTKVSELVLVDINKNKTLGEAMDLNHCLAFSPSRMKIYSGDYSDCKNAAIVCIAAGRNQEINETRTDLIKKNNVVFKSILKEVLKTNFSGTFVIATNPVDVMTMLTLKETKFPANKVIGTGTTLDTARLRFLLSSELKISSKNMHSYVVGEHGDSEFVLFNQSMVGLNKLTDLIPEKKLQQIAEDVKNSAYDIIKLKGATYYGIGMCLVRITNAILDNDNSILTVSSYNPKYGVCVSLPTIINSTGAYKIMEANLTQEQENLMQKSCNIIKENAKSINVVL